MDNSNQPEPPTNSSPTKNRTSLILGIILAILLVLLFLWLAMRGSGQNNGYNQPAVEAPSTNQPNNADPGPNAGEPTEPTNPNVTGGSSGAGNTQSNDAETPTPSPAGGVDTNNTQTR